MQLEPPEICQTQHACIGTYFKLHNEPPLQAYTVTQPQKKGTTIQSN